MVSAALVRRAAAFSASAAVLATLSAGLVAGPASAATGKAPKVTASTPAAAPADFEGACPATVNFSSTIKVPVKGKTVLAYRWLHGDGSKSKVQTVKLTGKGVKSVKVKQAITFKDDVKGWEAIQVLAPVKFTSKKGSFSVDCKTPVKPRTHLDVNVKARAWATPSSYTGYCTPSTKIGFVGLIETNRPALVRYRWLLNGHVADYGTVKVHDSRKVGFAFTPRHSERGWAQLQVLGSNGTYSNRAGYKVWCKSYEAPSTDVDASISVTSGSDCTVRSTGSVRTSGPGRVGYTWYVNGTQVSSGQTYAPRGRSTVSIPGFSTKVTGNAVKGGVVTLSVTTAHGGDVASERYAPCGVTTQSELPDTSKTIGSHVIG